MIFVLIKVNDREKIILSCVYFPPNSDSTLYQSFFNIIEDAIGLYPNTDLLLFGDFNLPHLNKAMSNPNLNLASSESIFLQNISSLNLFQINYILNSKNSMLDLILSNSPSSNVSLHNDPIVPIDAYHPPLYINYLFKKSFSSLSFSETSYDWKKSDFSSILSFLGSIDWISIFSKYNDISSMLHEFYSILFSAIDSFIPKKKIFSSKFPIWYSKDLKSLIKQKKLLHVIYKISKSNLDYLHFSSIRSLCKQRSKTDYAYYLNKIQLSLKSNPKQFWSFMRNLKCSSGLPNSLSLNNQVADNGQDIVNLFSRYFASTYKKVNAPSLSTPVIKSFQSINNCDIIPLDVFNELDTLNYKTPTGPDGINPLFLYTCRFVLSAPITFLFNTSLNTSCFPPIWKSTFINPILKNGDKSLISNYRPISIISIIPKIFSKIINSKISPLLNNILVPQQHGFRKKKSTITN